MSYSTKIVIEVNNSEITVRVDSGFISSPAEIHPFIVHISHYFKVVRFLTG